MNEERGMHYDFGVRLVQGTKETLRNLKTDIDEVVRSMLNLGKSTEAAEDAVTNTTKKIKENRSGKFTDDELRQATVRGYHSMSARTAPYEKKVDELIKRGSIADMNMFEKKLRDQVENGFKNLDPIRQRLIKATKQKMKDKGIPENPRDNLRELTAATEENTKSNYMNARSFQRLDDRVSNYAKRIGQLVLAYLSLRTAKRAMESLFNTGRDLERMGRNLVPFMGNMTNALNAVDFAQKKIAQGKAAWGVGDMVEGFKTLGTVGIDAQKNFDAVANMAGYANKQFSEAASAIYQAVQGNSAALEEFGIQEIYLRKLVNTYKHNTPELRAAVLSFISQQKQFEGGAKGMVKSMDGQINSLSAFAKAFKKSIIGRPDDITSLYSRITRFFDRVNNFIRKHEKTIKDVALGIAEVLKWAWRQVEIAFEKIAGAIRGSMKSSDGFLHNFRDKMMSFILWLELSKNKVVAFWNEYKDTILTVGKIIAGTWLATKGIGLIKGLVGPLLSLGTTTASSGSVLGLLTNPAFLAGITALTALYAGYKQYKTEHERGYNKSNFTKTVEWLQDGPLKPYDERVKEKAAKYEAAHGLSTYSQPSGPASMPTSKEGMTNMMAELAKQAKPIQNTYNININGTNKDGRQLASEMKDEIEMQDKLDKSFKGER